MVLGRIVTACAAFAIVAQATGARAEDFPIGMGGRGEDESRNAADEPAIASAHAGPQSTADFHSCPGDGLARMAIRGVADAAPGSRAGALFRSMLVPGYGQVYKGQRFKGGLLLGTEIALLSAALAFHLAGDAYNREARLQLSSDSSGRAQQLYGSAQARYRVRDSLLFAATGVWVLNMADAFLTSGRGRAALDDGQPPRSSRELAPLAAIRPGEAVFGLQGRF